MEQGVRMIALGDPEGSDKASQLIAIASSLGLKSSIITSNPGENFESFNHGAIDWKEKMAMAHWVVNSASMVTAGPSPAMAWSASMTFAELEGCRNVMIVDMPSDPESISMVWGQVIEKVRQIHVLFFTSASLDAISKLEGLDGPDFLSRVREKTMIPLVCGYSESDSCAKVAHALDNIQAQSSGESEGLRWLAGFLKSLPLSGAGIEGIRAAALWE